MRKEILEILRLEDTAKDLGMVVTRGQIANQICSLLDNKLADIFHSDNPFEGIEKLREEIKGE